MFGNCMFKCMCLETHLSLSLSLSPSLSAVCVQMVAGTLFPDAESHSQIYNPPQS